MSDDKDKTPEPEKEQKVRNFIRKHKTKIAVGTGAAVAAVLTATIFRQSKAADEVYRFIEQKGLTQEFMGLDDYTQEV